MKQMDRRVKYTMALLQDAMVTLLGEKHISRISVKQLCERADVNRSTFYAHFADQYALLQYIERQALASLKTFLAGQEYSEALPINEQKINAILCHIKDNAPLYTALLDENCDGAFLEEIMRFAETFPTTFDRLDEATRRYLDLYSIHGLLAVVGRWLQNGTPEPTETIARLAIQMFSHGIMSFME